MMDIRKVQNNSGMILIAVMLVLVMLTTLAVSVARSSQIDLYLMKYTIGKVKTRYLAWAGFNYALSLVNLDSLDPSSREEDTLYYCAIPKDKERSPEDMFGSKKLRTGHFSVQYPAQEDGAARNFFGIEDEERKVNINAITTRDAGVLKELIILLGFDLSTARETAYSVVDWTDEDNIPSDSTYATEDDLYMSRPKPVHCKNSFFDSKEELLLVNGMTQEIYDRLNPYITIFPRNDVLKINFDTAPTLVLKALARSVAREQHNISESEADALVRKMVDYRNGDDRSPYTTDDRTVDLNEMSLMSQERVLFFAMNIYRSRVSNYLHIAVAAEENDFGVKSHLDAVVERNGFNILSWHWN